ncbi:MAG TPA: hypothetical protein VFS88_10265 [Micavibrio sp.]|nr:hypothetical protein [Micavibrio sp.]
MVRKIEHTYPSQLAVRAIAHAAKTAPPPSLLQRSLLAAHLLRAYLRNEWEQGRAQREEHDLEESTSILNNWRKIPIDSAFYGNARSNALTYLDECRQYLKNAYKRAAEGGHDDSANIACLGLTFLRAAANEDRRAQELQNKANIYYPVFETNPFLPLGVAREVLRDIDKESYGKHGRHFTGNIYYDPLANIENFYKRTSHLSHHLNPHNAPNAHIDDAVNHLAQIADKIGKFTARDFNLHINGPDQDFRDKEGVSLKVLALYLTPYIEAQAATVESQSRTEPRKDFKILYFSAFAARPKKSGERLVRNLPVPIPEPTV